MNRRLLDLVMEQKFEAVVELLSHENPFLDTAAMEIVDTEIRQLEREEEAHDTAENTVPKH